MKYAIILSLIMCCSSINAKTYHLADLLRETTNNSYQLKALQTQTKSNRETVVANKSAFLPSFGLQAGFEKITTRDGFIDDERTASIYGRYNLFNGLIDKNRVEKSLNVVKIAESNERQGAFRIRIQIERLYYNALYIKKQLEIAQESLERTKQLIKKIKLRINSGIASQTDLNDLKLRKSRQLAHIEFLQLSITQNEMRLFQTAMIKDDKASIDGHIPHLEINEKLGDLQASLPSQNESLKRLSLNIMNTKLDGDIFRAGWLPKIDLNAAYGYHPDDETGFDSNIRASQVSISASWEFYSGNQTVSQTQAAIFQAKRNEYQLRHSRVNALIFLKNSYQSLIARQKRLRLEEKNEILAKKLFSRIVRDYQKGVKDAGALRDAGDAITEIQQLIFSIKKSIIDTRLDLEQMFNRKLIFNDIHIKNK